MFSIVSKNSDKVIVVDDDGNVSERARTEADVAANKQLWKTNEPRPKKIKVRPANDTNKPN